MGGLTLFVLNGMATPDTGLCSTLMAHSSVCVCINAALWKCYGACRCSRSRKATCDQARGNTAPGHPSEKENTMSLYQRGKSCDYDFQYRSERYTGCIGPVSKTIAKEILARKKAEAVEGRYELPSKKLSPR